jgi:DNA-binding PadR family transcriptional regulator
MKKLTEKMPGVWKVKSGSLYPLLRRMTRKGLLESKVIRGKTKYRLTQEGTEAVDQYIEAWKELYLLFKQMNKREPPKKPRKKRKR